MFQPRHNILWNVRANIREKSEGVFVVVSDELTRKCPDRMQIARRSLDTKNDRAASDR